MAALAPSSSLRRLRQRSLRSDAPELPRYPRHLVRARLSSRSTGLIAAKMLGGSVKTPSASFKTASRHMPGLMAALYAWDDELRGARADRDIGDLLNEHSHPGIKSRKQAVPM